MLQRMICMMNFFHILPTACITMRNCFYTNLVRQKAILRVFETNVCANHDLSFSIQIMHVCVSLRIIFCDGRPGILKSELLTKHSRSCNKTNFLSRADFFTKLNFANTSENTTKSSSIVLKRQKKFKKISLELVKPLRRLGL